MLPTIDISLIGVLVAIWHVFTTIWAYTSQAFNWITQKALALALGSKLWATAFFVTGSLFVISLISRLIEYIVTAIGSLIYDSIPFGSIKQGVDYLSLVIPLDEITSLLSFFVSCLTFYVTAQNYVFWYIKIYGTFLSLRRSFKI